MPIVNTVRKPSFVAIVVLAPGLGAAAVVGYDAVRLEPKFGNVIYTGISPGGILSGYDQANGDRVVIVDGVAHRFPYPDDAQIGVYGAFGDSGIAFNVNYGAAGDPYTGILAFMIDGTLTDIGYAPQGTSLTLGGQNANGVVVGRESTPDLGLVGFVFEPGSGGRIVPTLDGIRVGSLELVNDHGWLVGRGISPDAGGGIFAWREGEPAVQVAAGSFVSPNGINNVGAIVGYVGNSGFYWEDGQLSALGDYLVEDPANPGVLNNATTLASAEGINESGTVVGYAQLTNVAGFTPSRVPQYAWLWKENDGINLLDNLVDPDLNLHLMDVVGIAGDGSILASGLLPGDETIEYFLLHPIPEPSPLTLTLFVLFGCQAELVLISWTP